MAGLDRLDPAIYEARSPGHARRWREKTGSHPNAGRRRRFRRIL